MRIKQYAQILCKLADYLTSVQRENGDFPDRVNYGFTFSVLLWLFEQGKYKKNINKAIDAFNNQDKTDKEFPWEFNNYAILKIIKYCPEYTKSLSVDYLKNKGTPVTNWRLLRLVNKARIEGRISKKDLEFKKVLKLTSSEGLICDEPNTRSFQYHCFSVFLMGELSLITKDKDIEEIFLKAALWIANRILSNGQALYLGRGQEQIFGYGALLFVIELAYKLTEHQFFSEKATKVLTYLSTFQRDDGSFPLVLRHNDKEQVLLTVKDKPYGWFSYNTLFDYMPFLGYCLTECIRISETSVNKIKYEGLDITQNSDKIFYIKKRGYEAVWAIPTKGRGYWNDEMPVPYIIKGIPITPIYGGDPIWTDIYSPALIPLPYGIVKTSLLNKRLFFNLSFKIKNRLSHWCYKNYYRQIFDDEIPYFFANQLGYKYTPLGFRGENLWFQHKRNFWFSEEMVQISDTIRFKKEMELSSFYSLNLFLFHCGIREKNKGLLVAEGPNFEIKIERIEGKILIDEQLSPLGRLIWIREDIGSLVRGVINRRVEICLK